MKRPIQLLLVVLLIASCNNNRNNYLVGELKKVGSDSLPSYKVNTKDIYSLSIPDELSVVTTQSLVKDYKLIRLETNDSCLISRISNLLQDDEYFFILDAAGEVFAFDTEGKFLHRFGEKGKGPGEHLAYHSISIDSKQKVLYALDFRLKKIFLFDYSGRLIKEKPTEICASNFAYSYDYLFFETSFQPNTRNAIIDLNQLVLTDSNLQPRYCAFPYSQQVRAGMYATRKNNALKQFGDSMYFCNVLSPDTLWRFYNHELKAVYSLAYSGRQSELTDIEILDWEENRRSWKAPSRLFGVVLTGDYICFKISNEQHELYPLFLSNKTKQIKYVRSINIDTEMPIRLIDLMGSINPEYSFGSTSFIDIWEPSTINRFKVQWDQRLIDKITQIEKEMLSSFQDTDNPVLVVFTLHDF